MAADIVPELYEKIHAEFEKKINSSKQIKTFRSRLQKKTADAKGVSIYAAELGRCAAEALTDNLTEKNLPDEKLYWNIADRTIRPILEEAYSMVLDAAEQVQLFKDENEGINIKPIRTELPKYRIRDFMNKLIEITEVEDGEEV